MCERQYPPGENDVLACFLAWLAQGGAGRYQVESRPDQEERNARAYDYNCVNPDTNVRIAVEVTSAWRHEEAGSEDAAWVRWRRRFGELVNGNVDGEYHASVEIGLPTRVTPEEAATEMLRILRSTTWTLPQGRFLEVTIIRAH